mgnify:CR=1 FL=1
MKESERGRSKGKVSENKKQDHNDNIGLKFKKYKGSKGRKRLVQEMSRRVPLGEKIEVVEVDNDCGKTK